jgi:hypothetical protein
MCCSLTRQGSAAFGALPALRTRTLEFLEDGVDDSLDPFLIFSAHWFLLESTPNSSSVSVSESKEVAFLCWDDEVPPDPLITIATSVLGDINLEKCDTGSHR